jgi:hypothetical protein
MSSCTPLEAPDREFFPIHRDDLIAIRAISANQGAVRELREDMDKRFEKVECKIENIEGQVEEANLRLARIEEKSDTRFDTVLQAVLDQNKAASQGSIFMNPSVQIIAAIALLMLLAGALGKDFIITTPVVDVTTTEGP